MYNPDFKRLEDVPEKFLNMDVLRQATLDLICDQNRHHVVDVMLYVENKADSYDAEFKVFNKFVKFWDKKNPDSCQKALERFNRMFENAQLTFIRRYHDSD